MAIVRTVEGRGARDVAKRALETTGQIFRYAIAHGYADRNPAADIKPRDILKATQKANYARVDAKDLPELLRQIEVYQGTHVTRLAMKLPSVDLCPDGRADCGQVGRDRFRREALEHSCRAYADVAHRSAVSPSHRGLGEPRDYHRQERVDIPRRQKSDQMHE